MAASAFLIPNPTSTGGPYLLRSRGASSQQHGQGVPRLCRIWHLPSSSLARGSSSSFLIVFFSSSWSSGTSAARFLEAIDVPARDARPPAAAGGEDEDRGASRLSQQLARRSALGFQPAACCQPLQGMNPGTGYPYPHAGGRPPSRVARRAAMRRLQACPCVATQVHTGLFGCSCTARQQEGQHRMSGCQHVPDTSADVRSG